MKTRIDFVSNSSSSSFIMGKNPWFDNCNITKEVLNNILLNLYGNKSSYYLYDLSDDNDRYECLQKWKLSMSQWYSEYVKKDKNGNISFVKTDPRQQFEKIMESLDSLDMISYTGIYTIDDINRLEYYDRKTKKYIPVPYYIRETLADVWRKCGIITGDECLILPISKFFIHFDENQIWTPDVMHEASYNDDPIENDEKYNNEIKNSRWETGSYTIDRFYEVLTDKLVSKHIVSEKDRNRIYKSFISTIVAFNAHEG